MLVAIAQQPVYHHQGRSRLPHGQQRLRPGQSRLLGLGCLPQSRIRGFEGLQQGGARLV